jgi:hypothetical protein
MPTETAREALERLRARSISFLTALPAYSAIVTPVLICVTGGTVMLLTYMAGEKPPSWLPIATSIAAIASIPLVWLLAKRGIESRGEPYYQHFVAELDRTQLLRKAVEGVVNPSDGKPIELSKYLPPPTERGIPFKRRLRYLRHDFRKVAWLLGFNTRPKIPVDTLTIVTVVALPAAWLSGAIIPPEYRPVMIPTNWGLALLVATICMGLDEHIRRCQLDRALADSLLGLVNDGPVPPV